MSDKDIQGEEEFYVAPEFSEDMNLEPTKASEKIKEAEETKKKSFKLEIYDWIQCIVYALTV